jgi:flavin-dependent dehydrogenase
MYDAIVVGARCAGAPTALLLARKGYKVLLLDRGKFPSDMPFSNHYVHQTGSARLKRWGLLDALRASNCPPIYTNHFDYSAFSLTGSPVPAESGVTEAFAPRRIRLDQILVDAAVDAGVELREGFSVQEVLFEDGRVTGIRGQERNRPPVTEHARMTVGADGMFSVVAKAVRAPEYKTGPALEGSWYAYYSGVPMIGWHLWLRPGRVVFAYNTNDNLTLIGAAFAARDLPTVRANVERHHSSVLAEHAPELWERMQSGKRESRYVGGAIPSHVRKPYGSGWALVGDAGYQKDPCTASGITDAFSSAEWLADALDAGLSGRRPLEEALAGYEKTRNEAELPYFDLTTQLAALEPPPPEVQQLLAALRENPAQRSRFFGVLAHTVPVTEFFSPENMQAIFSRQVGVGAT